MRQLLRSILMVKNRPNPQKEICNHKKTKVSAEQINKSLIFLSRDHCKTCN